MFKLKGLTYELHTQFKYKLYSFLLSLFIRRKDLLRAMYTACAWECVYDLLNLAPKYKFHIDYHEDIIHKSH